VLDFKPTGFISVGIGPVSLDPAFVDKGPPKPNLSADLTFFADRMQVKIPPLPPSTKEEFKLSNELMMQNPEPNAKRYHTMALIFKQRADGTTIFPKLPVDVKSSHGSLEVQPAYKTEANNHEG
jgi:hypothetical protein